MTVHGRFAFRPTHWLRRYRVGGFLACFYLLSVSVQAALPSLSLSNDGVVIDAGIAGRFTLEPPGMMMRPDEYSPPKPVFMIDSPTHAMAKYANGALVSVELTGSKIRYKCEQVPPSAHGLRFMMLLPIRLKDGGSYAFGEKAPLPFPSVLDKAFLYQGAETPLAVKDVSGEGFSIRTTAGWQELADFRKYNWTTFSYLYTSTFKENPPEKGVEIEVGALPSRMVEGGAAPKFLVDRFGQSATRSYSGKVADEAELKTDLQRDGGYAKSLSLEPRDAFGGLPGSGEKYGLKKTGFFHLEKIGERDVLVTPEGNLFFQLGVCSLQPLDDYTLVKGRERLYEWIPPRNGEFATAWKHDQDGVISFALTNWIRKYGRPYDGESWRAIAIDRLRHWGFNSSGAFSPDPVAGQKNPFPGTPILPLNQWSVPGLKMMAGVDGLFDPFAENAESLIDAAFARQVAPRAKDATIIGYFLGNEQLFENLTKAVSASKGTTPSKKRLVRWLEARYSGDIGKFNEAWAPAKPFATFSEITDATLLISTPAAQKEMQAFFEFYIDTYYELVSRIFRKHDPNHLLIGSRWQPGTANNETLVRVAAKYMDVISVNYYSDVIDPAFLNRIHGWGNNRPMLLSEWHFTSSDRGMGGLREVASQKARGLAYRNYVENGAALPFIVGSQWFSYADQAVTGRWFEGFNGEAANVGLIDVADRPYLDFVTECKKTNDSIYDVILGVRPPFHLDDPRFTPKKVVPALSADSRAAAVFDALDLTQPGLAPVAEAWKKKDLAGAEKAFAAYLRQRPAIQWDLKGDNAERRKRADDAAQGKVQGGLVPLVHAFPGGKINWHFNATEHTPGQTPNNEWLWQLNRMSFWTDLAAAYRSSHDEKYATAFAGQLRSWVEQCPPPDRLDNVQGSAWRSIEAGIRCAWSWPDAFLTFVQSPSLSDHDLVLFVGAFLDHAHYLRTFNTRLNYLTMEMSGLYAVGTIVPEFKESAAWRSYAVERLAAETRRQFLEDGAQVELSTGYQNVALSNIQRIAEIAAWSGRQSELPGDYLAPLERAYDWQANLITPDRFLPKINNSWPTPAESIFRRACFYFPKREDFQWFQSNGKKGIAPSQTSVFLDRSGLAVMRSDWSRTANYLLFRLGPTGIGGHQHQDGLGVIVWAYGRELVFNGGGGSYEKSKWREWATSTYAHNCLLVDGLGQNRPIVRDDLSEDSNAISRRPIDGHWASTPEYDFACGQYDQGYGPGLKKIVVQQRAVLYLKPDLYIVCDRIFPNDTLSHRYQARWQLKTTQTRIDSATKVLVTGDAGVSNLAIVPLVQSGVDVTAASAQEKPEILGWDVRKDMDPQTVPATTLMHSFSGPGKQMLLTVFVPLRSGESNPVLEVQSNPDGSGATVLFRDRRRLAITCDSSGKLSVRETLADGASGRKVELTLPTVSASL